MKNSAVHLFPPQESRLEPYIEVLLTESFGQQNGFENVSLEEIGERLEEAKKNYELLPGLQATEKILYRSYQRCKDAYCRLLMEFESGYLSWDPDETIYDLRDRETRTYFFKLPQSTSTSTSTPSLNTLSSSLRSEEAKKYLQAAQYFSAENPQTALFTEFREKLRVLSLCFCIEAEGVERFNKAHLPVPKLEIDQVLRSGTHRKRLSTRLRLELLHLNTTELEWLNGEEFPLSRYVTALRKLGISPIDPTLDLFQIGLYLLTFGHAASLGQFPRKNLIHASGLSATETKELALRTFSFYQFKKEFFSRGTKTKLVSFSDLVQKAQRTLELLSKLEFSPPGGG